jgi:hypothetical protein
MSDHLLRLYVWQLGVRAGWQPRHPTRADQRGEGIISTAIAVLIMAFLGVIVWFGFRATLNTTQTKVDNQVERIGSED